MACSQRNVGDNGFLNINMWEIKLESVYLVLAQGKKLKEERKEERTEGRKRGMND